MRSDQQETVAQKFDSVQLIVPASFEPSRVSQSAHAYGSFDQSTSYQDDDLNACTQ